jgi:hypothetical protein
LRYDTRQDARSVLNTATEFSRAGYCVVRHLLPEPVCGFLHEYARKAAEAGHLTNGDTQVPNTPARYADPFMESVLLMLLPGVAEASGLHLFPTYSYFRVYKHGDVLAPHVDRPSCEVSVTISIGYEADVVWRMWVEQQGAATPIELEPGDGMLYRGTEVRHWRDAFAGTEATQLFLHYVDQDGPHREWKFDRRPSLGNSPAADALLEQLTRAS